MQLSSIEVAFRATQCAVNEVDVAALSGADATHLLPLVARHITQLQALSMQLSSHAVACNQHNVLGFPSGGAFIGSLTGRSERAARAELSVAKKLDELPEVFDAFAAGDISREKATLIAHGADQSVAKAEALLSTPAPHL